MICRLCRQTKKSGNGELNNQYCNEYYITVANNKKKEIEMLNFEEMYCLIMTDSGPFAAKRGETAGEIFF